MKPFIKTLKLAILALLSISSAAAQISPKEASPADVVAGVSGSTYISPRRLSVVSLPSQVGNAGKTITTDGTTATWTKTLGGDFTFGGSTLAATVNPRAPRQGLVFNGTSGATVANVPAFGTGDFTVAAIVRPAQVGVAMYIHSASTGGPIMMLNANGTVRFESYNASFTNDTVGTLTAGKSYLLTYTRTGGNYCWYINGVQDSTGANTYNHTNAINDIGSYGGSSPFWQGALQVLIYNRAISAAEVTALFEQGVPSGADYNNASNTALNTSPFTNGDCDSFSASGNTGLTAASASSVHYAVLLGGTISYSVGQRIHIVGSLTRNAGKTQFPRFYLSDQAGSAVTLAADGNFACDLVSTTTQTGGSLWIVANGDSNFTVSGVAITRLGLLLAPGENSGGSGLTWYDESGNAANITLPASGVKWNRPGNTTMPVNNLVASGNVGIGTTNPLAKLQVDGVLQVTNGGPIKTGISYTGTEGIVGTLSNYDLALYANTAEKVRITTGGNVGIGTTSPGAKLDVNGAANVAGNLTVSAGQITVATSATPASSSAAGTTGTIQWDANYVYVCVGTNQWKRTAIATW